MSGLDVPLLIGHATSLYCPVLVAPRLATVHFIASAEAGADCRHPTAQRPTGLGCQNA